jgi:hypothetical protein
VPKLNNTLFQYLRLFLSVRPTKTGHVCRYPPRCKWGIRHSRKLRSIYWYFWTSRDGPCVPLLNKSRDGPCVPLLKKSKKNAMKICVNVQTNIEMGLSDDGLSEMWKEPTGLTDSGAQGTEEFFLNSLTLELGTLRPFRSIGNYQSTLRKMPEVRKYKVGKL